MQPAENIEDPTPELSSTDDVSALVKLALQGDRSALNELSIAVTRIAFKKAVAIVGEADARDVAQEAALKVFLKLHTLKQFEVNSWIHTVARNCALDHLRKGKARGRGREDSIQQRAEKGFDLPVSTKDPATNPLVEECMQDLDTGEQDALRLVLIEGWTLDEAACQTGMSRATLQRRVKSGMAKFSKCVTHGRDTKGRLAASL